MSTCNDVLDDLADLAAGEPAAIARHAEHLATCDACRDLRHEATKVAELAAVGGNDYVPPADLAARVLAKLDTDDKKVDATADTAIAMPAATEKIHAKPTEIEKAREKKLAPAKKSKAPVWAAAAAAVAVVAGGSAILRRGEAPPEDAPRKMPTTEKGPIAATDSIGSVTSIARASTTTGAGVSVKSMGDWRTLAKGEAVPAGSTVKTDERTRVALAMADGTSLVLDHDTELTFASADARGMTIAKGRLVADVTHDEKRPASITTPNGTAAILGTKVIVTAAADLTSVQVVRGEVVLSASSGAKANVRAGEEGVIEKGGVNVASAPSLAGEIAWTELEQPKKPDEGISGVGALRAYKPGEKRDRDWNLALAKHDVKVRISGPIARTEITETFRNDSDATLEGVYQFPLPADAQIDGLALDVKDAPNGFLEGAFLDKTRAAKIWQGVIDKASPKLEIARKPSEIIWVPGRWRDPALLDWKRGGRFELKIFPIPAKGSRTIKIAYTQVVNARGGNRQYIYPLAHSTDGSTVADNFTVDLEVRGAQPGGATSRTYTLVADPARADVNAMTMNASGFVPKGDLVIDYKSTDGDAEVRAWTFAGGAAVAPDEKLAAKKGVGIDPKVVEAQRKVAADARPTAVLALRPHLPRAAESKPRDVMIVVDASQSMVGERYTRASELALSVIGQMDRRDRVGISTCDTDCRTLGDLRAPTQITVKDAKAFLAEEQVAGASDLVGAIRKSSDFASDPGRDKWVLYIGDGFASTGFRRAADVERAVASVVAKGVKVSTIGIGGDADSALLSAVARGAGGSYVAWLPGQTSQTAALYALESTNGAQLRNATFELPSGLADVAPTILPTLRAGEEILIAARLTGDVDGKLVLKGMVGDEPFTQEYPLKLAVSTAAGNAFVPRLWASLAIAQLERNGEAADRNQTVALSQGFGVMSKETSLLVLESQEMFDAFGVDRGQPTQKWSGEESLDEVVTSGSLALAEGDSAAMGPSNVVAGSGTGQGYGAGRSAAVGKAAAPSASMPAPVTPPVTKAPPKEPKAEEAKKRPADKDVRQERGRRDMVLADDESGGAVAWDSRPDMIAMRRTWVRVPNVTAYAGVAKPIQDAVAAAEAALAANPDSREKHRALVQALSFAGDIDRAREIATKWLERDKLDPSALNYQADLLGRDGKRDIALRTLAGIIDLNADRIDLHQRMVKAYEASGRLAQACSHRIALAAISPKDLVVAGNAIRCLRSIGREPDAELIRRALPDDSARATAEKHATVAAVEPKLAGDLVMDANWQGNVDLDISLVTPAGERISWMGGRKDSVAKDASSITREGLAVGSLRKGNYLIEITRGGTSAGAVRGTVDVRVLGTRRSMPFELTGDRTTVARLAVNLEEKWERVGPDDGRIPVLPGGGRTVGPDRPRPRPSR